MSDLPGPPKPKQSGAGWWIAGAALLVGYMLGQASGSPTVSNPSVPVDYSSASTNVPATADLNSAGTAAALALTEDPPAAEAADTNVDDPAPYYATSDVTDETSDDEDAGATPQIAAASPDESGDSPTAVSSIAGESNANPAWTTTPGQLSSYSNSSTVASSGPTCSESGSCYGDISAATGRPKTVYVHGYFRKNGTYVRSYYRSHH